MILEKTMVPFILVLLNKAVEENKKGNYFLIQPKKCMKDFQFHGRIYKPVVVCDLCSYIMTTNLEELFYYYPNLALPILVMPDSQNIIDFTSPSLICYDCHFDLSSGKTEKIIERMMKVEPRIKEVYLDKEIKTFDTLKCCRLNEKARYCSKYIIFYQSDEEKCVCGGA